MEKNVMDELEKFGCAVFQNVKEYRQKQVNKYYREKELEYGGEYLKLEKYKNRVRIIDMFSEPAKELFISIFSSESLPDPSSNLPKSFLNPSSSPKDVYLNLTDSSKIK